MDDVGDMLAVYLAGPGEVPGIGRETGRQIADGIAVYKSPHGSYRYVRYVLGVPVSALQLVSRDGKHATTANVYTIESMRRRNFASELLARARRDFVTVEHAAEEHRSPAGAGWVDMNKRRGNPNESHDDVIAWTVLDSARRAPRFGTRKVFISDLHRQLRLEGRDDGMTLPELKRELVRLMRAGLIEIARADLVAAMPADKVRDSELKHENATFHFVVVGGEGAKQNPPRTRAEAINTFADALLQRGTHAIVVAQDLLEEAGLTLAEASLDPSSAGILADDADAYGWFLLDNLAPGRVVRVDWNCKQTAEGYRVTWHVLVGHDDRFPIAEEYQEFLPYQEWPRYSYEHDSGGKKVVKPTRDEAISTATSFAWVLCKLIKRHEQNKNYPSGIHDWIHNFLIHCYDEGESPFEYNHPATPRPLIIIGNSEKARALREAYAEAGVPLHQNPSPNDEEPMPSSKAIRRYTGFHQKDPKKIGSFAGTLKIPSRAILIGDAVHVLYKSDKLNPTTGVDEGWINYIHEHDGGVHVYRCDGRARGEERAVPQWLQNADDLVWLGQCNGFAYQDDEGVHEAKGSRPLPDLFCTPNGKALLIIQGKRTLLAMIWGGRLGVQPRGIIH